MESIFNDSIVKTQLQHMSRCVLEAGGLRTRECVLSCMRKDAALMTHY